MKKKQPIVFWTSIFFSLLIIFCSLIYAFTLGVTKITVDSGLDGSHDIAIADIDLDGDLDIVADAYLNDSVVWYEQISSSSWTKHIVDSNLTNAHDVQVTDIDGDNRIDIVAASLSANHANYSQPNGSLVWYKNPADPKNDDWNKTIIDSSPEQYNNGLLGLRSISSYDMDNDSINDILVAVDGNTYGARGLVGWFKNPNGTDSQNSSQWTKYVISTTISNLADAQASDLDNDTYPDILTSGHHPENNGVTDIWWSPYDSTLTGAWFNTTLSPNTSWHTYLTDFDGDNWTDVLVAHWRHDKISWYKNPQDSTGFWWYYFSQNRAIEVPNYDAINQSTNNFTISAWFKPNSINFSGTENQWSRILHKDPYQLAPNRQQKYVLFQWGNDTGGFDNIVSDVQEWTNESWTHIVVTINAGNVTMYIDGVAQSDTGYMGGLLNPTSDNLYIGNTNSIDRAWYGDIDDVRIWNRTLNFGEISGLYLLGQEMNNVLLTTNQIFYTSFDERLGNTVYNLYGTNGTSNGSLRMNEVRVMSSWNETIIDSGNQYTNGSMSIIAYDIDNDGDLDVAVNTIPNITTDSNGYFIWYERNNTAGTEFIQHIVDGDITNTQWSHDLKVDDINNDTYGDIVGVGTMVDKVMLYLIRDADLDVAGDNVTNTTCDYIKGGLGSISGQVPSLGLVLAVILIIGLFFSLFFVSDGSFGSDINPRLIITFVIFLIILGLSLMLGFTVIGGFC